MRKSIADETLEEIEAPLLESSEDPFEKNPSELGFPALEQKTAKELVDSLDLRGDAVHGERKDRAEEAPERRVEGREVRGGFTAMGNIAREGREAESIGREGGESSTRDLEWASPYPLR